MDAAQRGKLFMRYSRKFCARIVACTFLLAAVGTAAPLTLTITGTGSGSLGGKGFTNASFSFTVTGDTTHLDVPGCCAGDIDTASGTPTTFSIMGFKAGTLMDDQSIWTDKRGTVGIAHFNDGDMIDLTSSTLNGFVLTSSIGPVTGVPSFVGACPGIDCTSFNTSLGGLYFSSVTTVTFTASVITTPVPTISNVFDQASAGTRLAPGEPIQIVGTNFGTGPSDAPTVEIGSEAAPLETFINGTNLIAIIPYDAPLGATTVTVTSHGEASNLFPITISSVAPAIMPFQAPGGSSFYDMFGNPITSSFQAVPNQQIYLVAIGLGATNPVVAAGASVTDKAPTTAPVGVTVGNNPVTPDYAGLQVGNVSGYYQVVFRVPAGTAAGAIPVTITVGGATSQAVTLQVGPPVPSISAIVNGATFQAKGAAPNSFISIYGVNFGNTDTTSNVFPSMSFDGVSVTANSSGVPLYYVYGSLGQINLVLPSELPDSGNVSFVVKTSQGASSTFQLQMAAADVGLFRIADPSNAARNNGAVLFAGTAWRVMPASMATAIGFPSCANATPATNCGQPAKAKDIVELFVTGLGKATPNGDPNGQPLATGTLAPVDGSTIYKTVAVPTVTIGGLPAAVGFSGIAPGNAGLYQINVTIPDGVPTTDDVPVVVTMPGGSTDTVTIAIQPT
jgi:uncharacterized protein (TIGR03437 family)